METEINYIKGGGREGESNSKIEHDQNYIDKHTVEREKREMVLELILFGGMGG